MMSQRSLTSKSIISTPFWNKLRTPVTKSHFHNIATVTPKLNVTMNSVQRKPLPGEQVISMDGSPLMVASDHVTSPSIILPLNDGTIVNVMKNDAAIKRQLRRYLDEETKEKICELKSLLDDLVQTHDS